MNPHMKLPILYRHLIAIAVFLCTDSAFAEKTPEYRFKGEYFLSRTPYDDSVCQSFTRNLNQFRKVDFDSCHPKLSTKFPEFTRPPWEEIPFDMAIAEDAIKSAGSYGFSQVNQPSAEAVAQVAERYWQRWKALAEPYLRENKARMWRLKADIDGDGAEEILIRLMPGDRSLEVYVTKMEPHPRLTEWNCDYSQGELYVLEAQNPQVKGQFNSRMRGTDLIRYADNGQHYLLEWRRRSSGGRHWDVPEIGATRSVLVEVLYEGKPPTHISGPVAVCFIDWVPTGSYKPARQPHRKSTKTQAR